MEVPQGRAPLKRKELELENQDLLRGVFGRYFGASGPPHQRILESQN